MNPPVTSEDQRNAKKISNVLKVSADAAKNKIRAERIGQFAKSLSQSHLVSTVRTVVDSHLAGVDCRGEDLSVSEGFFQDHRLQLADDVKFVKFLGVDHSFLRDIESSTMDASCFPNS